MSTFLRRIARRPSQLLARSGKQPLWPGSARYWEDRYRSGGTSGVGSIGEFAAVKAQIVNDFVRRERVKSVIEFGCGDGLQLTLSDYPAYIGLDVSETALAQCAWRFADDPKKSFFLYSPFSFIDNERIFHGELALSLEVIFHLIEDEVFDRYMQHLFSAADRFVLICSTDVELDVGVPQRRHRQFSAWVDHNAPDWERVAVIANPLADWGDSPLGARQDFFFYARR
jgi:hypothetical protein